MSPPSIIPFPLLLLFIPLSPSSSTSSSSSHPPPSSPLDCGFDLGPSSPRGFCAWLPDSASGARIWHSGNAVLVDAVHSVVGPCLPSSSPSSACSSGDNRFAFAQGQFGQPTEGSLRSPLLPHSSVPSELRLTYWKASVTPSLDICVVSEGSERRHCVDTIQGPGQQQWVRRAVELPASDRPYRVVISARNLLAAEDIIGLDDIQLLMGQPAGGEKQKTRKGNTEGEEEEEEESWGKAGTEKGQTKIFAVPTAKERPGTEDRSRTYPGQLGIRMTADPGIRMAPKLGSHLLASLDPVPLPPAPSHSIIQSSADPSGSISSVLSAHCPPISCSFLDGPCLWNLGPGWHTNSRGSVSVQSPLHSTTLISSPFRPPLTSSVDFDLLLSEEAELNVAELAEGRSGDAGTVLFTRRGATDGGWHRFRVPLRPSASPVRLVFRARLSPDHPPSDPALLLPSSPPHSLSSPFVSLSNLKLANGDGNEIGCGESDPPPEDVAVPDPLADFRHPAPLLLPSHFPFPGPLLASPSPSASLPPPALFNPLQPMFFDGLSPIVPLRDNPPRLTALMGASLKKAEQTGESSKRKGMAEEEESGDGDGESGGRRSEEYERDNMVRGGGGAEGLVPFGGGSGAEADE